MLHKESNYDFCKRLLTVHRTDLRNHQLRPEADEFSFRDSVRIGIPPDADEVLLTAAKDFADYLFTTMNVEAFLSKAPAGAQEENALILHADPALELGIRGYRITVDQHVMVEAADSRGLAQGLYYLEDVMNLRRAPFLKKGSVSGRPMFESRQVMSGYGMGEYPDEYLSLLAHHGFTSLMLWIKGVNETKKGFQNFKDLGTRAAKYGLDIYIESYAPHDVYPEGEEAQKYYDELYGNLFRLCPFIKGLVIVGEAAKFVSRDPDLPEGADPGWYPCKDWPLLLDMIRKAVDKIKPGVEIVLSSYNWNHQPQELRRKLNSTLPKDVILNCVWDLSAPYDLYGTEAVCRDYSLRIATPSPAFLSEAAPAVDYGLRLETIANTGGKTWDFGAIPYMPAPYRWAERFEELRKAHDKYNLSSLMDSIHYGVYPSMITEIAKWAFREPRVDLDEIVPKIIALYYGEDQLSEKLEAMRAWSEALANMVPTVEDQYGALRIGPSHPFYAGRKVGEGVSPPQDKFAMHRLREGMYRNVYHYYRKADKYTIIPKEIAAYEYVKECLEKGIALLDGVEQKNEDLERLINMGRFMHRTILTALHMKQFYLRDQRRQESSNPEEQARLINEMIDILCAERENAVNTIPLVNFDSILGFEPSMEYVTDEARLLWKINQVDEEIQMLRTLL